jgi:hypothetical protein
MSAFNKSVSISIDDRMGESQGDYIRKSICYTVGLKNNKTVGFKRKSDENTLTINEFESEDNLMYCFTVPSGMLVLRRNNNVFITGNSGKDPSKVDRSGAYYARYVAKNIIAAGLASKIEIQVAYAIGVAKPVSIMIDTFGTNIIPEDKIIKLIEKHFDFRPANIIKELDLRKPIYKQTACYGHFGRDDLDLPWERLDKVESLIKDAFN